MLGLAVLGRISTGEWLHWGRAWLHPIALERRKSGSSRYGDFEKSGDLVIARNIGEDVIDVIDLVSQIESSGRLDKIGVDPVGISAIVDALEEIGIDQDRIVGISQGWKLNGAIKTCERRLAEGTLLHGGSDLMAWCVSNCRIEQRGNAITITKAASGFAKIDPIAALFNAATLLGLAPQPNIIGADYELITI